MTHFYLLHPPDRHLPGFGEHVSLAIEEVVEITDGEISIVNFEFEQDLRLDVNEFVSKVRKAGGPVLLVEPVKNVIYKNLQRRLGAQFVVQRKVAYDKDSLLDAVLDVWSLHQEGNPQIPTLIAAGVLLINKLAKEKYWGGTRNKNFIWASDIPKGRGFPEEHATLVPRLLNDMLSEGLLLRKKSQGKWKYALDISQVARYERVLSARDFGSRLNRIFSGNSLTVSARSLDKVLVEHLPAVR